MVAFKEVGRYKPPPEELIGQLPDKVIRLGGLVWGDGNKVIEVRPPRARLRWPSEGLFINGSLAKHDILVWPLRPEGKPDFLPMEGAINVGAEVELAVIDMQGQPVDLACPVGDGWLLDWLGGGPEGLRFQIEYGVPVGTKWQDVWFNVLTILKKAVEKANQIGVMFLPTGEVGYPFVSDGSLILPHPYIKAIHDMLGGTALAFDTQTVQAHVDLRPYGGSLEMGHLIANWFNDVFATMINGVYSASPFKDGKIGPGVGMREYSRRQLLTVGGVQPDYDLEPWEYVQQAHLLLQKGVIPVAERTGGQPKNTNGNGVDWQYGVFAHNDTRIKCSSVGTFEAGPADMNPNVYSWIAQMFVVRRFVQKVVEAYMKGQELPAFLRVHGGFVTRQFNRNQVVLWGPEAKIKTAEGPWRIRDLWYRFYDWALTDKERRGHKTDFTRGMEVILRMLDPAVLSDPWEQMRLYFDPRSKWFMRGNFGSLMLRCARSLPDYMPDEEKIRMVNLKIAEEFNGLVRRL